MASQALLELGGGELTAKTVPAAISRSLLDVLTLEATDASDAARILGRDPLLLSEARRSFAVVKRLSAGVGADGVYVLLQPLVILFDVPDFGPGEAGDALHDGWVRIYGRALGSLCHEALESAVSEWIQKGKPYWPKPSDLYKLAEPIHLKANMIAYRLRKAVEVADAVHQDRTFTPEEVEERRRIADEIRASLGVARRSPMAAPRKLGRDPHQVAEELRRAAG